MRDAGWLHECNVDHTKLIGSGKDLFDTGKVPPMLHNYERSKEEKMPVNSSPCQNENSQLVYRRCFFNSQKLSHLLDYSGMSCPSESQ